MRRRRVAVSGGRRLAPLWVPSFSRTPPLFMSSRMHTPEANTAATPGSVASDFVVGGSRPEFIDRRTQSPENKSGERRQFGSSHTGLTDAGRELALAIDQYKLQHHRRYITCDEMLFVITNLGYSKD